MNKNLTFQPIKSEKKKKEKEKENGDRDIEIGGCGR